MMRFVLLALLALSLGSCLVIGCAEKPAPSLAPAAKAGAEDSTIAAAIAKLPETDRAAASSQKFCVIESKNRLGSMGMPHRILVEGKPVFLCCTGCEEEALKDPAATLAKVEALKAANSQ